MNRLFALGLGLLAIAFLWVWRTQSPVDPVTAVERDHTAREQVSQVDAEHPSSAGEGASRESLVVSAVEAPPPASGAVIATPATPDVVKLHGAAIRVDNEGRAFPSDSGQFRLSWFRGGEFVKHQVEVIDGAWSIDVQRGVQLHVSALILADFPISLEENEYTLPENRFLTLQGEQRRVTVLHVLSERDGAELDSVEVWPSDMSWSPATQHPGSLELGAAITANGRSPISIPPPRATWRPTRLYFVRAPGHAWASIEIDHAARGERTLTLSIAGSLEVELVGNAEWLDPKVRLWPPGASRWDAYATAIAKPDRENRAVFESLAPGTYVASVERGWANRRISYGKATVEVLAGEQTRTPIVVELPEQPTQVAVSGSLVIPRAWERTGLKLIFSGEGDTEHWLPTELDLPIAEMTSLTSAPDGCESFAWSIQLPAAGMYRLEVSPLLVRQLLGVPTEGLSGLEILVPAPADVEVHVIDARSGEPIVVDSLRWSVPHIPGITATSVYSAVRNPEKGCVTFRAPAAEVRLSTSDRSLLVEPEDNAFFLKPGLNQLELRAYPQIGVRFTFRDGEATIPWDWTWRVSAHEVGGDRRDRARSIGILWFLEEGTYALKSNDIPGYGSIDGFQINVVRGQGLIEVEVPLVVE